MLVRGPGHDHLDGGSGHNRTIDPARIPSLPVPPPIIDWSARLGQLNALGAQLRGSSWVSDFVSMSGQSTEERNPSLRIRIPAAGVKREV